jgi:hypothetical protein
VDEALARRVPGIDLPTMDHVANPSSRTSTLSTTVKASGGPPAVDGTAPTRAVHTCTRRLCDGRNICVDHDMSDHERIDLSDDEVDAICAGLVQNAAKLRYLREVLKLRVDRRPNGRPLVRRADWFNAHHKAQNVDPATGPKWSRAA